MEKIKSVIPEDKTIKESQEQTPKIVKKNSTIKPIIPNPKELSIESLYKQKITSLEKGTTDAELYHRLISHAVARVFRGSLRNMEIKVNIDDGIKIIDTVFTNCAKEGFFQNLKSKVECSYPMIEVKSISGDPTNTELDQLNGRLNENRGHFGILICRDVKDKARVCKRCKTYLPNNYVLFLTDKDIFELLDYSKENSKDDISDFMDRKLRDILF